jgi:hypothetical protein
MGVDTSTGSRKNFFAAMESWTQIAVLYRLDKVVKPGLHLCFARMKRCLHNGSPHWLTIQSGSGELVNFRDFRTFWARHPDLHLLTFSHFLQRGGKFESDFLIA